MFFASIFFVCLVRAGFVLKLVCHRIYSKSTDFVVCLLTNHFVIFFSFWWQIWAVNEGTDVLSINIQRKSAVFLQSD